ncbi:MAG: NAD-dependent malic enzyme [Lentisphaeria bacterium]|nr:NAD-dependent malic enzyme [Lentisphaeria bacterium]
MDLNTEALAYHSTPVAGKLHVIPSKPCATQHDLALAYTPGVAKPCLEIKDHPVDVFRYTGKGNTVAVVSDGTAVLGLGNIGPEAGLPVMEGKCVLFKRFAGIDAMPLCLTKVFGADGKTDAKKLIDAVETLEPTFGGINLEDIAAPACFEVETTLKKRMGIPVFHDDQHGTAIISLAALLNAAKLTGKKLSEMKVVGNGAGAAGLSCLEFYITAGVLRENVVVCDSKGVVTAATASNSAKRALATSRTDVHSLADAMKGADVFLGCSVANCVTEEMVRSMASGAVVFAMANPTPEIMPDLAKKAGAAVVGTGRTDFPNQINNVLGFPGIFRGALDVRATDITQNMQLAASYALAEIAQLPVEGEIREILTAAYPEDAAAGVFDGKNPLKESYVIPKPFDPRVVPHVARFVAEAAMKDGVAKLTIDDLDGYEAEVARRIRG